MCRRNGSHWRRQDLQFGGSRTKLVHGVSPEVEDSFWARSDSRSTLTLVTFDSANGCCGVCVATDLCKVWKCWTCWMPFSNIQTWCDRCSAMRPWNWLLQRWRICFTHSCLTVAATCVLLRISFMHGGLTTSRKLKVVITALTLTVGLQWTDI